MQNWLWTLWFLIPLGAVAFWCFICFIISLASGWHHLAGHFRAAQDATPNLEGQAFYLQRAQMNGSEYKGCLNLKVANQGLYLSVLLPFRAGHAPLLIPWNALSDFELNKIFWMNYQVTTITSPSGGKVKLGLIDQNLIKAIQSHRITANM